jgi:hypothetical protein
VALPLRRGFAFDSRPERLRSVAGEHMRIRSDVRKAVAFLGHIVGDGDRFQAAGTGFFLMHDTVPYLVTARHIAEQFGDDPFYFRVNDMSGEAADCYVDPLEAAKLDVQWFFHDDPNVDVAVMPLGIDMRKGEADFVVLSTAESIGCEGAPSIDTGDLCQVIGLFSLHPGKERMTPVIHTGHIAMMPDPREPIPTEDWRGSDSTVDVEGYLIEISNMQGLSGSPVMIRPTMGLNMPSGETAWVGAGRVYLLGVWQGSWEGRSAIGGAAGKRVPVGMGIVTPIEKLMEVFNSPACRANRELWRGSFRAVPDA